MRIFKIEPTEGSSYPGTHASADTSEGSVLGDYSELRTPLWKARLGRLLWEVTQASTILWIFWYILYKPSIISKRKYDLEKHIILASTETKANTPLLSKAGK